MMTTKIRVLVVDDSVFMRSMLKDALDRAVNIEVIGTAQNGKEALERIKRLKPDVVTLDIEMPGIDGLEVLRRVMKDKPVPIVMVSTKTQAGAHMTFEALQLGAIDYVAKPLADKDASLQSFRNNVVHAVEAAFASNRNRLKLKPKLIRPRKAKVRTDGCVVAIGISAGGPATLHEFIPLIPAEFPPVFITQHMPADFTGPFAKRLDAVAQGHVYEACANQPFKPGDIILAPGRCHLAVRKISDQVRVVLDEGPKVSGFRPSVDVLFNSIAKAYGSNAIGLVMTGMGFDGSNGIKAMKEAGAITMAQDKESSIVYGMPKAAASTGCIDHVVSLSAIPDMLIKLLSEKPVTAH